MPWRRLAGESPARRAALALTLGLVSAAPLFAIAQAYEAQQEGEIQSEVQSGAARAGFEWERYLRDTATAVRLFASFWENSDVVELDEFRSFTTTVLNDIPGLLRFYALTPEMTVRWTMPPAPLLEEAGSSVNESWRPALNAALGEAGKSRERLLVYSGLVDLSDGTRGYILVVGLHAKQAPHRLQGFAIAELAVAPGEMFTEETRRAFLLQIREGDEIALGPEPAPERGAPFASVLLALPPTVRSLAREPPALTAWPTSSRVAPAEEAVVNVLRAAGLVLGLALGALGWRETGRLWERRRAASRLRETNEELARKVHELDSFSHVIAHDLKNPIRGIAMGAAALDEDYGTMLPSDAMEDVHRIRRSADRMQEMVDAILAYATSGGAQYEREDVEVESVISQALADLAPLIEERSAIVDVASGLPTINAQRIPLRQVFANLVSNAVTHNPAPDPRVRIGAQRLPEGAWEFAIEDNGPGVPARDRDRIFELFQRGTTARPGTGTGIGLATVKRIVQGQGGRVWVEEAPGGGSVFRFTIPDRPA